MTTDTFKLRGDYAFDLSPDWQFVVRGDLPYLAKDPVNSVNPDGEFIYGLGDADVQGTIIHTFDSRWKAGAAVRLITPSGDWDNGLGSGLWRVQPAAGFRYSLPEISSGSYFEPFARYDQSFAGDPAKKEISNLQFAPFVNFSLPDRFFLSLYPSPDIRWNFGPAGDRPNRTPLSAVRRPDRAQFQQRTLASRSKSAFRSSSNIRSTTSQLS